MSEKTTADRQNRNQSMENGGKGKSMAPPAFQLKADPIQMATDECPVSPNEPGAEPGFSPDYDIIAQNVWDAMFGGIGWGTDEQKVYDNLALLQNDGNFIETFKSVYQKKFGSDIVSDIGKEFSDSAVWGDQKTQALSYLQYEGDDGSGECELTPEEQGGPQFELDEEKANGTDEVLESAKDVADNNDDRHLDDLRAEYVEDRTAELVAEGMDEDAAKAQAKTESWSQVTEDDGINCSLFVKAALNDNDETSDKMDEIYKDKGTGLPVGYRESNKIRLVENHMVVNLQPEATRAIIDAQKKPNDMKIVKDSDEYTALLAEYGNDATKIPDETFLFSNIAFGNTQTFIGQAGNADLEFGAGAAAISMGGKEIDEAERRPGDLQQTAKTDAEGKFTGKGHSSIIYEVKGTGVGYYEADNPNCPIPDGWETAESGWYRGNWIINGLTNPFHVAEFAVSEVKLIDANTETVDNEQGVDRGEDATQIGDFSTGNNSGNNQLISNGRLPDSKWIDWAAWNEPNVQDAPVAEKEG